MVTVTAFQAKTRFGELLDRVVRGEEIVITRHEKAVARLIPEGGANLKRAQEAVAELRAGRSVMAKRRGFKPLSDSEIQDAIEEGRPWPSRAFPNWPRIKDCRFMTPRIWNSRCEGNSRWLPVTKLSAKPPEAVA